MRWYMVDDEGENAFWLQLRRGGEEEKMEGKELNVRIDCKKLKLAKLRGVINELVKGGKGREENTFISKVGMCSYLK